MWNQFVWWKRLEEEALVKQGDSYVDLKSIQEVMLGVRGVCAVLSDSVQVSGRRE